MIRRRGLEPPRDFAQPLLLGYLHPREAGVQGNRCGRTACFRGNDNNLLKFVNFLESGSQRIQR